MLALGMIEVYGRVGAIEGLDSALKAANVSLVNVVKVGGGLTSVFVEGDVGAVKAAIEAAAAAAERVGELRSVHVIPRPDKSVRDMLDLNEQVLSAGKEKAGKKVEIKTEDEKLDKEAEVKAEVEKAEEEAVKPEPDLSQQNYDEMTVKELRTLAVKMEEFPIPRGKIKFAKKKELVEAFKKINKGE